MPKQVIVIMDDHYPFGQCQQSTSDNTRVLVRKIYEVSVQQKNKLLQKAAILKRLKYDQLIKLQSVLQQEESIHFLFQYVPIRLQTWISNINDQFIENFRDQLIKFSSYLANNFIRIEFRLKNIGMDHNYGAKYFLDPSFVYDTSVNKERLKSQYIRDISNLFKPYIDSNQQQQVNQVEKVMLAQKYPQQKQQPTTIQNSKSSLLIAANTNNVTNKNNNSISPPTYDYQQEPQSNVKDITATNSKTKEKLQKYYQHMNASMDVENQKILKQFMDVLDDEEEEEIVAVQPGKSVIAGQQNRSVPIEYQYGYESSPKRTHSKQQIPSPKQVNVFYASPKSQEQFVEKKSSQIINPSKIITNQQISTQHAEQQPVVWKNGDDLQERIKKAIQNSKSIINRFKNIKQTK